MAPLIPRDLGFTADLLRGDSLRTPRARRRRVVVLAVIVAAAALGFTMLPPSEDRVASEANNSQQSVPAQEYVWRVYVLNQTSSSDADNGTTFTFRTEDLPYDFRSISFGDFRSDAECLGTYYGGCGILVEANGSSSTVVLRESCGRLVSSVQYNGQDPVVFSGERRSVSYPKATTSYYGTDIIVEDWRNGTWSPDDGIIVEHPDDVSIMRSEFYLMLFEPEGNVEIPEFNELPIAIIVALASSGFVICRRNRQPCRKDS